FQTPGYDPTYRHVAQSPVDSGAPATQSPDRHPKETGWVERVTGRFIKEKLYDYLTQDAPSQEVSAALPDAARPLELPPAPDLALDPILSQTRPRAAAHVPAADPAEEQSRQR